MRPATAQATELTSMLIERVAALPTTQIVWTSGLMIVIDNTRLLHSRAEPSGANLNQEDRCLERVLIGPRR
jgi:hypothetical protein